MEKFTVAICSMDFWSTPDTKLLERRFQGQLDEGKDLERVDAEMLSNLLGWSKAMRNDVDERKSSWQWRGKQMLMRAWETCGRIMKKLKNLKS